MTTETDVKQRLAALHAVLAAATNPDGSAMFEGFRQACDCGRPPEVAYRHAHKTCPHCRHEVQHSWLCEGKCNGTGWQVRAGGLEDGLAGLEPAQKGKVLRDLAHWIYPRLNAEDIFVGGPSIDEERAEGLRLVCEVAGLEVPDA